MMYPICCNPMDVYQTNRWEGSPALLPDEEGNEMRWMKSMNMRDTGTGR